MSMEGAAMIQRIGDPTQLPELCDGESDGVSWEPLVVPAYRTPAFGTEGKGRCYNRDTMARLHAVKDPYTRKELVPHPDFASALEPPPKADAPPVTVTDGEAGVRFASMAELEATWHAAFDDYATELLSLASDGVSEDRLLDIVRREEVTVPPRKEQSRTVPPSFLRILREKVNLRREYPTIGSEEDLRAAIRALPRNGSTSILQANSDAIKGLKLKPPFDNQFVEGAKVVDVKYIMLDTFRLIFELET